MALFSQYVPEYNLYKIIAMVVFPQLFLPEFMFAETFRSSENLLWFLYSCFQISCRNMISQNQNQ
jgi:hypothetical protein